MSSFQIVHTEIKKMLQLLIVLLSVIATALGDSDHCIWYKQCYTNDDGKTFNCAYDGPGEPLVDEDAQRILLNRCPDIFTNCKRKPKSNEMCEIYSQISI